MEFSRVKSVRLDICTMCQLNCACCYMRHCKHTIGTGYVKFDVFKNFIERNNFIEHIELSNSGEIFLNPDLLKIIKFAHDKNITLSAYNGVNLNTVSDEILEALVKYNFKSLTCSIDGASQETYSKYRIGGNFDKVMSNVQKIVEFKNKYNSEFPYLTWQFIVFGHNEFEIPIAKKQWQKLGFNRLNFVPAWNKSYSPLKDEDFVKREVDEHNLKNSKHKFDKDDCYLKSFCTRMWTQPQINHDGRLLGCCCLADKDFGANVFEIGLEAALKSEKFKYAKKMLTNKAASREGIPCSTCIHFQKMQQTGEWIKEEEILKYLNN